MIQDHFTDAYSKQGNRDKVSSWLPTFEDLEKYLCKKPFKNRLTWVISEIWLKELLPKKM